MKKKKCWNYFAFKQLFLSEGKIAPKVLLAHEAKLKHMISHGLTKGKIARTFAPCGKIDTIKYFGSCATEWAVSDLVWISESTILKFRIRIGYGAYEKFLDPIRLQNFHICTPLISMSDPVEIFRNPVISGSVSEVLNPVGSRSGNRIMFNTCAQGKSEG